MMAPKQQKYSRIISLMFESFLRVPYLSRWVVLLMDTFISVVSFTITSLMCYQLIKTVVQTDIFLYKLLLNTVVMVFFFWVFETYKSIIRYSNYIDILRIFIALLSAEIVVFLISHILKLFDHGEIYIEAGFFINFVLTFSSMFLLRMFVKVAYDYTKKSDSFKKGSEPLFIFGISSSSVALGNLIDKSANIAYHLAGFVSLDDQAANKLIINAPVYSMKDDYKRILKTEKVKAILINPKELERKDKQDLADFCIENKIRMLVTPPIEKWNEDVLKTVSKMDEVKQIQIEDLLGRIPIQISIEAIREDLEDKCILITGAAGSIGSEIVRQIAQFNPRIILLCDIAETPLHYLSLELKENYQNLNFVPVVCDVRNKVRMEKLFKSHHPHHVYHAAAYKHVPLMEDHPSEAILTNVLGSKNMVDLAIRYRAEAFVMISTDKAVNPTNIMGTSKRIAEIYVQSLQGKLESQGTMQTRVITTRFGNVLGSNGSVIPRFKEQIAKGGPVTVTHPEIIRYFMTIPESCRLVLEAANMGKGGEIFVFDMGDPVKIVDMAKKMIRLSGFVPYEDIDIVFTGLRPGEKLYEELLADGELVKPTYNRKIKIANIRPFEWNKVYVEIKELLKAAVETDDATVVAMMKQMVPEFHAESNHAEMPSVCNLAVR